MAQSDNADDTMPTEEKPNVEQVVWEPPSDGEPPREEEVPIEKPSITQVDDAEVSKENGHLNGSINEGIIEEPQSETESEVFHNTNANIQEVPEVEPAAEEAPEMAPEIKIHSESSGEDEPLSRLRKPVETVDLVHAFPSPNPYAHIRGRPGLRSASPYRTQSVPVSPINFGFPPLTRVDGQLSLQKDSERKRPRAESPTLSQNAKRPCRGWSISNWWNGKNGATQSQSATETLGNPNPRTCALM